PTPAGFAPSNIQNLNDKLYATYAKQNAEAHDDLAGPGNGFVDVFRPDGSLSRRLVTRGRLNSPWGLAIAPGQFGRFSSDLLIGNFGDGRINAFSLDGEFEGQLRDEQNRAITIPGLWG